VQSEVEHRIYVVRVGFERLLPHLLSFFDTSEVEHGQSLVIQPVGNQFCWLGFGARISYTRQLLIQLNEFVSQLAHAPRPGRQIWFKATG
jgi:hypothetical protein